ncbi:hypothetical protein FRZ67_00640 [Panacibacter ginsenosidivorans]|uniref:Uncharacterized protein n=1 Tax=Panacibacter ginsenosidivorans TaxID=1813871 RepID=A0A5B8V3Y0_9BACT|nr:hypothetical protein [Panacibacter ginsenosidivorans]QEC65878.1 hypothetical protein FRZ67_00640 [Panacibacter ginsenosidivorans]
MFKKILPSVFFLAIISCNASHSVETKAYIFERKLLDNGELLICYTFNSGNALVQDSSIITNMVIPQDSISIVYEKSNPANSNLLMPGY